MEPTDPRVIHKALAHRLANRDLGDDVVAAAAKRIAKNGMKVLKWDFCPYGICIDYMTDRPVSLDELVAGEKYRELRLFPYGIIDDDLWRVSLQMHVPELAEFKVAF